MSGFALCYIISSSKFYVQVFYVLKQLDREYIKRFVSRRELLFLPCLTVTPNCHRVMEVHSYNDGPRLVFVSQSSTDHTFYFLCMILELHMVSKLR